LKAISLAEASKQQRARDWLGSLYNNLGWTHHDAGRFNEALGLFEKALAFRISQKKPDEILIARWCIARTLRSLNRVEDALKIQKELEAEHLANSTEDIYVFEELAELYSILGMADLSKKYFERAKPVTG
jgi:tetratricopeptide (TPR) repeat protein